MKDPLKCLKNEQVAATSKVKTAIPNQVATILEAKTCDHKTGFRDIRGQISQHISRQMPRNRKKPGETRDEILAVSHAPSANITTRNKILTVLRAKSTNITQQTLLHVTKFSRFCVLHQQALWHVTKLSLLHPFKPL